MKYFVDNEKVTKEIFMEELENAINDQCENSYDDMLDECYDAYKIGYSTFYPSEVLKQCDPIAYRCGLSDYQSAELEDAQYKFESENFDTINNVDFETKDEEENPLDGLETNLLGEINGKILYLGYDEKEEILYAGSATNNGIFRDYEIEYDHSETLDFNIQRLMEEIER